MPYYQQALTALRIQASDCIVLKPFAMMRPRKVQRWANGYDARRVDIGVRDVVVPLDVIEIDRPGDVRLLVKIAQIVVEIGVIDDAPQIAFEMSVINRIEPHQRAEEPPVGL